MPRSFLVKKHHSSGKPDYGRQRSKAEEASWDTSEDSLLHNDIPRQRHCPELIPQLEQTAKSTSTPSSCPQSLRTEQLHFQSASGHCSEAYGRSSAETCRTTESRPKVSLDIRSVTEGHRRREGLLPPSLPLVALFPAILPGSSSSSSSSSHGRLECLDCHNEHLSVFGLAKHKQFQCEWSSKKYFSCKYCEKEYVSLGALKMHIRTHTLPCVCNLCGKAFSRPWLLQGHIRTHTGEKPFSCLHCSRAFADRSNLRAHLQTHSEMKKYQCACCLKTFSRISLLAKHQEAGCPLS